MVEHALACSKGGLVLIWQNTAAGKWGSLCSKGHQPTSVSQEPFIKISGTTVERAERAKRVAERARGEG